VANKSFCLEATVAIIEIPEQTWSRNLIDLNKLLAQRPLGLVFDIDGTLSPIVPTPDQARLYPGIAELLVEAKKHAHIAILTGRAILSGAAIVNVEGLTYIGTHGEEWSEGLPTTHEIQVSDDMLAHIIPGQKLLALAEEHLAGLAGVKIEHKRFGGSIHYRAAAKPEQARQIILDLLREPADEYHFHLGEGKQVVDIRPISAVNKGTALRDFARHFALQGVLFAGDDRTDLDALLEIERLRQEGLYAVSVVVQAPDTFPGILEHADSVVQGVAGMAQLLQTLVEQQRNGQ
jgi:trehalose 6-phosphate phosphatase